MKYYFVATVALLFASCSPAVRNVPLMADIPAGSFLMGGDGSGEDYDETPVHEVVFDRPFRMGRTEVTNLEFEEFDPGHERLADFNPGDSDAVVNVTWKQAQEYCRWLSKKTSRNFRLPTEAEWEYACRAGTTTAYYTGDTLPLKMQKHQRTERNLVPVSLAVAQAAPNAWGLYDMHGNVEEWCLDWYAEYMPGKQCDPEGPVEGNFKVTRGGSHNTEVRYLRSANRSAATPDDSHSQIGFRVVESEAVLNRYEPETAIPAYARNVVDEEFRDWKSVSVPIWLDPIPFVLEPSDGTPFYSHNHQPAITWCGNGDLLAIWFSCDNEHGREMVVLASRLRSGASSWEPASLFFRVPDRNITGSALCHLPDGTILHMNGVANSGDWQNLALCARRSTDDGATWSKPVLVEPAHAVRHQVIAGTVVLADGSLLQACDAGAGGQAGTSVHISRDNGFSWEDAGGDIRGIHAGVVQLKDGSLLAFGRGQAFPGGLMPKSTSADMGKTWNYEPSAFPTIGKGQRLTLTRLREGPILLSSFGPHGLFVCISEDEGGSWSEPKLLTDGSGREFDGGAWTGSFAMTPDAAEPRGYCACTQTPDGIIHLVSSRLHYRFNLAWICRRM